MKKYIYIALLFASTYLSFGQIKITEIFYDTPYNEDIYFYYNQELPNPDPFFHHLGEYIELYNYSDEDIVLKGWYITDKVTRFDFADTDVIRKGQFIVVAFNVNQQNNYFKTNAFFPNTPGTDDQIFYQNNIMLRNERETVKLHMGFVKGLDCKGKVIQSISWGKYSANPDIDYMTDNGPVNDYYVPSLHIGLNNDYYSATADPLAGDNTPPTQHLLEIPDVIDSFNTLTAWVTWDMYSDAILANTCDDSVTVVSQSPPSNSNVGICFSYDPMGNCMQGTPCNPPSSNATTTNPPGTTSNYTSEELDAFNSKITIAPNPTIVSASASWTSDLLGKIISITISNMSGSSFGNASFNPSSDLGAILTLPSQSGIYIVIFQLDSGQNLYKNIIRI